MKPSDLVTAALLACLAGPAAGCHREAAPAPDVSADSAVTATGESAIAPLVTLTPEAADAVARVVREQRVAGRWYLRVRVVPGGCTGFQHKLDLDLDAPAPDDRVTESSGISVVVSAQQVEMLRGTRLDFGVEGGREGFIVKNPNFEGERAKRWLQVLTAQGATEAVPPAELAERITQFERMTREDPDNELAHYRLGQLLMEAGRPAEAAVSFERAVGLNPEFVKAHRLRGECLAKAGQRDRAVAALTAGLKAADRREDKAEREALIGLLDELGSVTPVRAPKASGCP